MKIFRLNLLLAVSTLLQRIRSVREKSRIREFVLKESDVIRALPPAEMKGGTVIIKCDDIGDFLIWQHVIPEIKKHASRPLVFVGNKTVQPMAEAWFDFADRYIWVDKSRWQDGEYRKAIYHELRSIGAETAYTTLFTRNYRMDDLMLAATGAARRIAWDRSHHTYFPALPATDFCATETVLSPESIMPEFMRHAEFISKIYHTDFNRRFKPLFPSFSKQNRLVVFPAANTRSRWWKPVNYADVIRALAPEFDSILLLGGSNACDYAAEINRLSGCEKLNDMTGRTSLTDLMALIGESRLLICPDTSAMHFAVHTKTDVILLSNGNNWQRFASYEPYVESAFRVLFPPHVHPEQNKVKIHYNSAEIQAIKPADVIRTAHYILSAGQKEQHPKV